MRVVKVSCPSCGGELIIAEDSASTTCEHCRSQIVLDWEGQTSAAVYMELGRTFLQICDYDRAKAYFVCALEKNAHSRDAWLWLGVAHVMWGATRPYLYGSGDQVGVNDANFYLDKSGFTDEEAIEVLTRWMRDSGLAGCISAGNAVADHRDINERALGPNSCWYGIFDQTLRNCQKRYVR